MRTNIVKCLVFSKLIVIAVVDKNGFSGVALEKILIEMESREIGENL